ncbi:MBL fold metallo-hydrolase [Erysipelothrix urinaevulpis]|uniref:MBL fold metallo-hydrolase n=1 Tax=Erysipelothrix urinaevulpis TaxID=2683717 RepID=UPI00135A5D19|nr:MBL fold metallo-hydrolase [Erysipelothrix urinaevulpis]
MVLKDKKTKITFHSGILTIGGTVIEVEYDGARIFFDFGTEFKPELNLKDERLQTLIEHRLVPHLDSVYDSRLNYNYPHESQGPFKDTAVFLSHVHLDHTRMVNYLDPSIPMYALKETKLLLESLNANNDFILPLYDVSEGFTRDIIPCNNKEHIKVGEIDVELLRVDHDAYGACGLLIKTPDLFVAYTGDLRLHGFDRNDSLEFVNQAKGADIVIIEGVSISFPERPVDPSAPKIESEQDLLDHIVQVVNDNPDKQLTFNCYPANVKRMKEIVEQSPRQVVMEASFAHILKECLDIDVAYYGNDDAYQLNKKLKKDYNELIADDHKYLWQVVDKFENLKGGGVYIHSDATPLGDFDPAYQPFLETLKNQDVEFIRLACSGHAKVEDLNKIVDLIEAKVLVPIHSLRPELLENPHGKRYLPERGSTI